MADTYHVKDHVVREVVNRLRDTALEFHAHGSLRERLARQLDPLLVASRPAEVDDWISVEDRLPSTEDLPNGDCPSVIALWKPGALAENMVQQMVITTSYLCKNVEKFTHWMNLPAAPSHTTNKEKD